MEEERGGGCRRKTQHILPVLGGLPLLAMVPLLATRAPAQADRGRQQMTDVSVTPNLPGAAQAGVPRAFGALRGVENVGRSTMLWFEAADGTIRRVQVSFWEDEIILDNQAVTIERY